MTVTKKESRCTAVWTNRQVPDFECKLTAAHSIHVDPKTGTRWGDGSVPRGMRRKGYKKYANVKLSRQSAVAVARGGKKP